MKGEAFCPAHITGFFSAYTAPVPQESGSMGAGFSIARGVTTRVQARETGGSSTYDITTQGFDAGNTRVSNAIVKEFLAMQDGTYHLDITHEIGIPVGYGLGCSGAAALSLALALGIALPAGCTRQQAGVIAHNAEVRYRTGLGDVLAAYHGGFEIRTHPGAPGVGRIRKMDAGDLEAVVACFEPMSTPDFLKEHMELINGRGGRMVGELLDRYDIDTFHEMSLEFAGCVGVITPRMRQLIHAMQERGIRCGVALFGQTVFALVPVRQAAAAAGLASSMGAMTMRTRIDEAGARHTRAAIPV